MRDVVIQRHCREYGVWDKPLTEWIEANVKPGWTCLDIGANNGYFTEVLARKVGKEGKVIAFEPNTHMCVKYAESTALNNYENVGHIKFNNVGLSDETGVAILNVDPGNVGHATMSEAAVASNRAPYQQVQVSVSTLSSYAYGPIDFIKIDVEGLEEKVFKGFSEEAKRCPLIVIELNNWASPEFVDFLLDTYNVYSLSGVQLDSAVVKRIASRLLTENLVLRPK